MKTSDRTIIFEELVDGGIKVRSTKTGEKYTIWQDTRTKKWLCSCPHFVFRLKKTGTPCKHIEAFLAGELDNALDEMPEEEL